MSDEKDKIIRKGYIIENPPPETDAPVPEKPSTPEKQGESEPAGPQQPKEPGKNNKNGR